MVLTKLRNGLELTWDSLDAQERQLVAYVVVYALIYLLSTLRKARRQIQTMDILEQLRHEQAQRAVIENGPGG